MNNGISGSGLYLKSIAISGSNIFAGTSDGVYLSTDNGNNWTAVNNGLSGNSLFVESIAISGSNIFAGTYRGGVFISNDNSDKGCNHKTIVNNKSYSWIGPISVRKN